MTFTAYLKSKSEQHIEQQIDKMYQIQCAYDTVRANYKSYPSYAEFKKMVKPQSVSASARTQNKSGDELFDDMRARINKRKAKRKPP